MEREARASGAYVTKLPDGTPLEFKTAGGVFVPTYTSELFIRAVASAEGSLGRTLDLGCGCGILGVAAAKMGKIDQPFYASDLSAEAVELTRENARAHGVRVEARPGGLFDSWAGETFDCVLDDVSGISTEAAAISPWYAGGVPCAAGEDGTGLTLRVLGEARKFLRPGGAVYFPVISLSATERILRFAEETLGTPERCASQKWMLPPEMLAHREKLREWRDRGLIRFEEKYGTIFCWTEVYRCRP